VTAQRYKAVLATLGPRSRDLARDKFGSSAYTPRTNVSLRIRSGDGMPVEHVDSSQNFLNKRLRGALVEATFGGSLK